MAANGGPELAELVADQNLTATLKVLEAAIGSAQAELSNAAARLAQLHINKGYCHQCLSLSRKALKDYDAALAVTPDNVLALFRRGQVLQGLNRKQEALVSLRRAASLADPATDLSLLMDVTKAVKALEEEADHVAPSHLPASSAPAAATAAAAAAAPAPAAAAAPAGGRQQPSGAGMAASLPRLEAGGESGCDSAPAAPVEPAVGAGRAPHAALASEPTADIAPHVDAAGAAGAGDGPAIRAAAGASGGVADSGSSRSRGSGGGGGTKVAKGFFGAPKAKSAAARSASGDGGAAASAAGKGATPTAGSQAAAGGDGGGCKGAAPDEVDIDCAASQDASRGAPSIVVDGARLPGGKGGGAAVDVSQVLQTGNIINLAVSQINAGKLAEARALLDGLLSRHPNELGALVARGTARALLRDLKGAVEDFGAAIKIEPRYPDAWKRRGQARSALGEHDGALSDLAKAADLMKEIEGERNSAEGRADCYMERGTLYQKRRDYRRAAGELRKSTKLDGSNAQAWTMLGLCLVSMGDIRDGVAAYEKAIELQPNMRDAWLNMGQALKEEGRTREAERALMRLIAEPRQPGALAAYRLLAQMRQGQGRHADAIKLCDKALALGSDDMRLELLYLRAICHHALGRMREAAADYDAVFGMNPREGQGKAAAEEATGFRFLSFFQKEMALYLAHNLDRPVADFCLDTELPAVFKESWCKKGPISRELLHTYNHQPPLPASPPPPPPPPPSDCLEALTAAADVIGGQLQNHHQGFLANARQMRAAGYAAIELAQAVQSLLAETRRCGGLWVNSEGASGQGGCSGRHLFGWRDAIDIAVKWRQLSEPNDQVVWVDLLTRREFEAGFGSHTPLFSGQTKCVRYYMNFDRALALQKRVLLSEGYAFDAQNRPIPLGSGEKREAISKAATAWDMYRVIGTDSWVVVPLASLATPGSSVEGTRLTLVRVTGQPDAVEFSIRTPVTPPRWKLFEEELESAWDRVVASLVEGNRVETARAILQFAYYWYNFMPLARGTAAVGYTTMLGLFWAAGMPVMAYIPKDYQVDWEAILSQHPDAFIDRLAKWMLPDAVREALGGPAAPPSPSGSGGRGAAAAAGSSAGGSPALSPRGGGDGGGGGGDGSSGGSGAAEGQGQQQQQQAPKCLPQSPRELPPVSDLPRASEVLSTSRRRIEALNGPGAPRLAL